MKRITLTFFAATLLLFACNNNKTASDTKTDATSDKAATESADKPSEKKWIPVDTAMMNKAWMESMVITDHHKMLAKANGTWNGEVTMWMSPDAPPMKSTSTSVNTMMFNDLYQVSKHKGNMMGMPFEGMSTTAYDNVSKEYVSTWIDNMGSGIMVMKGNWDEGTKSVNLSGTIKNPANGLDCTIREIFKNIDDNT